MEPEATIDKTGQDSAIKTQTQNNLEAKNNQKVPTEVEEIVSDAESSGSGKSGRGILSNLTLHDSSTVPNLKRKRNTLNKRNLEDIKDSGPQDSTQKKLKNAKNEIQSPGFNSKSSPDKSSGNKIVSKRLQLKNDIESARLIEFLKKDGDIIDLDTLATPGKPKRLSPSKSQQEVVVKQFARDYSRSMSKNSITPKTPNSIRSLVASALITPPKIDYKELAQYNTVEVSLDAFLTEEELAEVFDSPPPQHVPAQSFRGIYLERKVFAQFVPSLQNTGLPPGEVVTEYYSLQIDQNICYFEYGVIEEPDAMQCQLHESYDFIESYCLTHRIKQLRTEIGFEEKREKLVYSLNQKLIDTIKQNQQFYFKHERRICDDPDTSFRVLQSQERSLKSKAAFNQDDRQFAVMRDLNSGSRRSGLNSTNASKNRVKSSMEDSSNLIEANLLQIPPSEEIFKIDLETKETDNKDQEVMAEENVLVSRHNPNLVDKDPQVNLREDVGQSDLDMIYDKFSHSNPLHEFVDIDINLEFRSSYEVS